MRLLIAPLHRVPCALVRALLALAASAVSTASVASEPTVLVGEVCGRTPLGEFSGPLKGALFETIARTELGQTRDHFVLSATLVSLESEQLGRGARATAAVSLVLRRAREQTLHAVLTGHATAEATESTLGEMREDALRAAVRSALRRLPEALR